MDKNLNNGELIKERLKQLEESGVDLSQLTQHATEFQHNKEEIREKLKQLEESGVDLSTLVQYAKPLENSDEELNYSSRSR